MMRLSHHWPTPRPRLRGPPRRTARLRLAALCGGLFLVSGVALLASTYVLFERATEFRTPRLPNVPHTPAIQPLQQEPGLLTIPPAQVANGFQLPEALSKLASDQYQLAQAQHQL